jgi:hypothetical protein
MLTGLALERGIFYTFKVNSGESFREREKEIDREMDEMITEVCEKGETRNLLIVTYKTER